MNPGIMMSVCPNCHNRPKFLCHKRHKRHKCHKYSFAREEHLAGSSGYLEIQFYRSSLVHQGLGRVDELGQSGSPSKYICIIQPEVCATLPILEHSPRYDILAYDHTAHTDMAAMEWWLTYLQ